MWRTLLVGSAVTEQHETSTILGQVFIPEYSRQSSFLCLRQAITHNLTQGLHHSRMVPLIYLVSECCCQSIRVSDCGVDNRRGDRVSQGTGLRY